MSINNHNFGKTFTVEHCKKIGISQQVPEFGQPELVQKEYDIAMQKINTEIKNYDNQLANVEKEIDYAQHNYKGEERKDRIFLRHHPQG